jgi:alpha-glucosidase
MAYTTFTVQAQVDSTKDLLLILGDAFALGEGSPDLAPQLYPYDISPPIRNLTVQLPAHTKVEYEYVLYHYSTDGSYTYEKQNRTLHTSGCNNLWDPYQIHDTMSSSKRSVNRVRSLVPQLTLPQSLARRQTPPSDDPGSMQGLPGRELLYPPYNISNYIPWGDLSVQTLPTNIYHSNGLVEYDVHNLYGTMMSTASRYAMESRRPGRRPLM